MQILYLTFYFEPDIGPGSFRNTAFVRELANQLGPDDTIHVLTTQPNRYQSYRPVAPECETWNQNGCPVMIERISVPTHKSGPVGQVWSFVVFGWFAYRYSRKQRYTVVVASSARLFTAFLGAFLARRKHVLLILDIRDLFREVMRDMSGNFLLRSIVDRGLACVERYTFSYAHHINLVSEGFRAYFTPFPKATYSYFSNGIDDVFQTLPVSRPRPNSRCKIIVYAGNIGEGQGLHKIIPPAAHQLGDEYRFVVLGDGSARKDLEAAIIAYSVSNVELRKPVGQSELINHYQAADYLFVHLNDLDALTRVLPSKLFEYGATDKPILAGVSGHAASFVRKHIVNYILFAPGDVAGLVSQLRETPYYTEVRADFRTQFQRQAISQALARQILKIIDSKIPNNGGRAV